MYNIRWSILILLLLSACHTVQHVAEVKPDNLYVDTSYDLDSEIESIISPYRSDLTEQMDVSLGELPVTLTKSRPNSNMGNWFTDILHEEANKMFFKEVDFAVQNYGGLRVSSITSGPLTIGEVYQLMPFDNLLVVLELDGKTLQKFLNALAAKEGWPISHSLSFTIKNDKAIDIMINGEPFDPSRSYRVAMADYIANGGDQSYFLKEIPQEESGVLIRDIIIAHLEELKETNLPIEVTDEIRIRR